MKFLLVKYSIVTLAQKQQRTEKRQNTQPTKKRPLLDVTGDPKPTKVKTDDEVQYEMELAPIYVQVISNPQL